MLKLKLQYFDYLAQRANSVEKTLILGRIEGRRLWKWQRMRWLDGINGHELGQTLGDGEGQGSLACWVAKSWTWLDDWTTNQGWSFLHWRCLLGPPPSILDAPPSPDPYPGFPTHRLAILAPRDCLWVHALGPWLWGQGGSSRDGAWGSMWPSCTADQGLCARLRNENKHSEPASLGFQDTMRLCRVRRAKAMWRWLKERDHVTRWHNLKDHRDQDLVFHTWKMRPTGKWLARGVIS